MFAGWFRHPAKTAVMSRKFWQSENPHDAWLPNWMKWYSSLPTCFTGQICWSPAEVQIHPCKLGLICSRSPASLVVHCAPHFECPRRKGRADSWETQNWRLDGPGWLSGSVLKNPLSSLKFPQLIFMEVPVSIIIKELPARHDPVLCTYLSKENPILHWFYTSCSPSILPLNRTDLYIVYVWYMYIVFNPGT